MPWRTTDPWRDHCRHAFWKWIWSMHHRYTNLWIHWIWIWKCISCKLIQIARYRSFKIGKLTFWNLPVRVFCLLKCFSVCLFLSKIILLLMKFQIVLKCLCSSLSYLAGCRRHSGQSDVHPLWPCSCGTAVWEGRSTAEGTGALYRLVWHQACCGAHTPSQPRGTIQRTHRILILTKMDKTSVVPFFLFKKLY